MHKNQKNMYMEMALNLAVKAEGKTYPNPMVGAVVIKNGKIIGKGYHKKFGKDHAEVMAIKDAHKDCCNATMFVTLEPCNHYGKTPPCTDAIIKSGIKKVYIAMKDPNPLNSGSGIRKLKKAGIVTYMGCCEEQAKHLNRKYVRFMTEKMPYITIKLAQSIDGKIAARDGSSKWISSDKSRKLVKKIRKDFDAIMIGRNTLEKDNPFLLDEKKTGYKVSRIVIDSKLKLSLNSNIIKTAKKSPVIIGTTDLASGSKIKKISKLNGIKVVQVKSKKGKVNMKAFLKELAKLDIINVMVEGGGELIGSLLEESLVQEIMCFISPKIIGGSYSSIKGAGVKNIKNAINLKNVEINLIENDLLIKGIL